MLAQASAPLRIACGGTLDIATLALWHYRSDPATLNFTLSARISASVFVYDDGIVRVECVGVEPLEGAAGDLAYDKALGLYAYLCDMRQVDGIRVLIESQATPASGLGSSAAGLVAMIGALDAIRPLASGQLSPTSVALLAYRLESAVTACGVQDDLAAAYGGCNLWRWAASPPELTARREIVLPNDLLHEFSESVAVAYTGTARNAGESVGAWSARFMSGDGHAVNMTARAWTGLASGSDAAEVVDFKATGVGLHVDCRPEPLHGAGHEPGRL